MKNVDHIPANVHRAVSIYAARRRIVSLLVSLFAGAVAASTIAIIFMIADRYVETSALFRLFGLTLFVLALLAGLAGAAIAIVRRHDPFTVAARIDRAFPQHLDRWSSSIDLSERLESGAAGNRASLDRLFSDTEKLPAKEAASLVPLRPLWFALGACALTIGVSLFMKFSPAFDVNLLWQRFSQPYADLPRDASTKIVLLEVNRQPFAGAMPGAIPEGSPLGLRLELRQKPGIFEFGAKEKVIETPDQLPPRLEQKVGDSNTLRVTEFNRAGTAWIFTQPRLEETISFRIRANDAVTQTLRAEVLPRIKMTSIESSVRFPRYSRLKDQPMAVFRGFRISTLSESVVDFQAKFDRAFSSVSASYESMKLEKDPAGDGAPPREEAKAPEASRRSLRVQKRGDDAARFTLPVDASGILRVSAVGANGLPSEEWVCSVEAVPDSPPRIVVSGIEPISSIVPGETFSFQYRAEDDLAVTDLLMDWSAAGGIHSSELGGEEYLKNDLMGQKVVTGQELIQRLNYKFYGTEPFQFFLKTVDSKGQESRTETFRVYTVSDDYATRFDRGITLFRETESLQRRYLSQLSAMEGQINIIATAAGDAKKWDAKLDSQLDNYMRSAQTFEDSWFFTKQLTLRYGGIPYRLSRSLGLLMAAPDVLASRADFIGLGQSLKATEDLPGTVARIRALIAAHRPVVELWGKAIEAERGRFVSEQLLNQARAAAGRLASIGQVQQTPEVAAANLKFYFSQVDGVIASGASVIELAPMIEALKVAREKEVPAEIVTALRPLVEFLSVRDVPLSEAMTALAAGMSKPIAGVSGESERFLTLVARVVASAGQTELLKPAESIALAQAWLVGATPTWFPGPPSAADAVFMSHQVWETLTMFRADLSARRFEINPQEGADREVILRERALATKSELMRLPAGAIDAGARDKLVQVMDKLSRPGTAVSEVGLTDELQTAIRSARGKSIADYSATAQAAAGQLAGALMKAAEEYERHADAVTQQAGKSAESDPGLIGRMLLMDQGARLQVRTEGLESLYRAVKMAMIEGRLMQGGAVPEWAVFEPLHGAQLLMSLSASSAAESVTRVHIELQNTPAKAVTMYPIIARNSVAMAARLRSAAQLLAWANGGPAVTIDYAQLMKDARAEGLLGALRDEYQLMKAHLPGEPAQAFTDAQSKLGKAALTRVVRAELAMSPLASASQQLRQALGGKSAELVAALTAIQQAVPTGPDAPVVEALPAVVKEAASAPATELVSKQPALARRAQSVLDAVLSMSDGYRDQARLPALNLTSQQNRRFTTRDLPYVWTIQGVIEGFDRRWAYAMREFDLSLTRTLMEVARKGRADADDLKMQYGRMVEWRARNFANDRRRNQGISLLAVDAGPSLKLPEHIADELLRARNLQAPEDFRPRVEAYYEELYRDLSK